MCRHEVEQVDVIAVSYPFDEPDTFRKRNRIRERLRKLTVSRVFQHPEFAEIEMTKFFFVVVQPVFEASIILSSCTRAPVDNRFASFTSLIGRVSR